jgi:succinate dehydrogenase/fumarate reductase iron-sulfur protein
MNLELSIRRYNPETDSEPKWIDYSVEAGERTTVLEALMHIYENIDPTLAFRFGCRFNTCGLCAVEVDGRPRMGCSTEIKNGMKIAPLAGMPVMRDLVIDRVGFFEGLRELEIYIPEQEDAAEPRIIKEPEIHMRLAGCLECLACNSTCPNYDFNNNSLAGPYVFVKLAQLHFDPRNEIDRRKQAQELGVDKCADCGKCYCIHRINIHRDVIEVLSGE